MTDYTILISSIVISILLLSNRWPQNQWLKVIQIDYSTFWEGDIGFHGAKIKVWACASFLLEAVGVNLLPSSFICWQNSVVCGVRTEAPVSLLAVRGHSYLLEAPPVPWFMDPFFHHQARKGELSLSWLLTYLSFACLLPHHSAYSWEIFLLLMFKWLDCAHLDNPGCSPYFKVSWLVTSFHQQGPFSAVQCQD